MPVARMQGSIHLNCTRIRHDQSDYDANGHKNVKIHVVPTAPCCEQAFNASFHKTTTCCATMVTLNLGSAIPQVQSTRHTSFRDPKIMSTEQTLAIYCITMKAIIVVIRLIQRKKHSFVFGNVVMQQGLCNNP